VPNEQPTPMTRPTARRVALVAAGVASLWLLLVLAAPARAALEGIHKIQHVVVIMQENRSFDSYFGTYPGADGIPGLAGNPGVVPCIPDPLRHSCSRPFHDRQDENIGGPHGAPSARADINGGKMNGFIAQQQRGLGGCSQTFDPSCGTAAGNADVVGYHTGADLPNYWAYAKNFVLHGEYSDIAAALGVA